MRQQAARERQDTFPIALFRLFASVYSISFSIIVCLTIFSVWLFFLFLCYFCFTILSFSIISVFLFCLFDYPFCLTILSVWLSFLFDYPFCLTILSVCLLHFCEYLPTYWFTYIMHVFNTLCMSFRTEKVGKGRNTHTHG
jgi:hypothetical protein